MKSASARFIQALVVYSRSHNRENTTCVNRDRVDRGGGVLPWFRVEVLLMSPEMKEDSDCFLTVSFHILLIRLCGRR
jgi:hypothetical protein